MMKRCISSATITTTIIATTFTATTTTTTTTTTELSLLFQVKNSNPWNPTVLNGGTPKLSQDSFMYREQNGVKSLLLDDDNCDCQSTLNVGHGMCLAGHQPKYSKVNVFGADALYDPSCHGPVPGVGLTLYYRVDRPMILDSYGGDWKLFWWWSAGTPWPKCTEEKKIVDVLEVSRNCAHVAT